MVAVKYSDASLKLATFTIECVYGTRQGCSQRHTYPPVFHLKGLKAVKEGLFFIHTAAAAAKV